eukprot:2679817-Pyramimonas_sp.AAC.1
MASLFVSVRRIPSMPTIARERTTPERVAVASRLCGGVAVALRGRYLCVVDVLRLRRAGLTRQRASSACEVMEMLQRGNAHRTTEPTRANATSSRSHAILQVQTV